MIDELVDRFEHALTGRVRSAFARCCAVDVHYEDPLCTRPLEGLDELADHASLLWEAFPDARIERTAPRLRDGRYVSAPCKLVGTHRGALPTLPATGRTLVLHGVLFCELDADRRRLWRIRAFYDAYGAGSQLGVFPRRGTLGERALLLLRGFGLRTG